MRQLRALWLRFRGLFSSDRRVSDFDTELESHLQFHIDDNDLDIYLAVQNVANLKFPIATNNNSTPDLYYMGVQGPVTTQYDAIGRFFTLGVRIAM